MDIKGYFGGTYESAKSDERKEFTRMLKFVKASKEKISFILVYSLDRFSRTGDSAIFIASELKKTGVSIMAVTQPIDTNSHAGALQQSDIGIAVSQNSNFTPASDVVMDVNQLSKLERLFKFAKASKLVITGSFVLSIIYNVIGLYFALQGMLAPVIAAILMPLSTITIVSFTTGMTTIAAKRLLKK